jgi:hypothetical protein
MISDEYYRSQGLVGLAPHLAPEQRSEALREAFASYAEKSVTV